MSKFKVLLTDYAWPDTDIECRILSEIDAELVVADRQDEDLLAELAADVDGILTCWAQVPQRVIEAATKCRIVSRLGIGLDNIDVDCCTRRGIIVTNVPDYCQTEVAEHTLALLFALARKVALFHRESKNGRYDLQAGPTLRRVSGQTLGIVGLGRIGQTLAGKASALGLKVVATSRTRNDSIDGIEFCKLNELLERSDYVSLHLPLTPKTKHIIGAPQFAEMKPTAYLINTARGDLIDHAALAHALDEKKLAGAALDVQSPEPPDLSQPPYNDPRVIVTPHAAFASAESLEELRSRATRHVAQQLTGNTPENVVNPEVL